METYRNLVHAIGIKVHNWNIVKNIYQHVFNVSLDWTLSVDACCYQKTGADWNWLVFHKQFLITFAIYLLQIIAHFQK